MNKHAIAQAQLICRNGNAEFDSALNQRQHNALAWTGLATQRVVNSTKSLLYVNPSLSGSQLRGVLAAQGLTPDL